MTEVKAYQSSILTKEESMEFAKALKKFCDEQKAIIIVCEEPVAVDMDKVNEMLKRKK